jgi:hypothetical protein
MMKVVSVFMGHVDDHYSAFITWGSLRNIELF